MPRSIMSQLGSNLKDRRVLRLRLLTSVVAIPVVVALIWFGSPWFTVFLAGWGMACAYEFYGIVKKARNITPLTYFGLLWVLLLIISPHFLQIPFLTSISPVSLLLTTAVTFSLLILLWRKGKENAFAGWAWTIAGILYIGLLLSYLVALRNLDNGRAWVLIAVLCTFASDSSAYLAGRVFGRHKLAPYISPKKTWEGSFAGALGAVAASLILVYLFNLPIAYWQAVILGFVVSVFGQLGDLVKSLFKRNMEVKDSGNIIPGHGGFLDRTDSLIFAGVTVYFFVALITPGI
jgi:phosphatidate cytidylyltransferase